jgi:hypothetical protein
LLSVEKVDLKFIFWIHKVVKYRGAIVFCICGGTSLKKKLTLKQRKDLEANMAKAFKENIKGLSTELQKILLDDLVTAFQNRINVLMRAQEKRSY